MQDECSETEQGRLSLLCAIPSLSFFLYILLVAFSFFFLLLACLDTLVSSLCFPLLSVPFSLSG